jgi:hypothetical protein
MSAARDALEIHLMKEADWRINKMIPPGGLDTFGDPEEMSVYGLGAAPVGSQDLLSKGGSASFGIVGRSDLIEAGSDSFGQFLVASQGEELLPEIDGMGDLGRFAWGRWAKRMRVLRRAKKAKARRVLKRAARGVKKSFRGARVLKKRAFSRGVGPVQRSSLLKRAQLLERQAAKLRRLAAGAAREVVAPRIRRHEAKAAMRPILRDMATKVAATGKSTIRRVAKAAVAAPAPIQRQIAKKVGTEAIKQTIAKAMTGGPAKKIPMTTMMRNMMRFKKRMGGGLRAAMSGFLGIEEVMNPEETSDIIDDWKSDDIFGEPLPI